MRNVMRFIGRSTRRMRVRASGPVLAAIVVATCYGPVPAAETAALQHARLRLLDGGPAPVEGTPAAAALGHPPPGARLAGLAVSLDPGYLTYWRSPGDAGVPPRFDAAGSGNLAALRPAFPAPARLMEAGAEAFGYEGDVIFPLVVTPADPNKPVDLTLSVDFGVCGRICLPEHAALSLSLGAATGPGDPAVAAAVEAVPQPRMLGAPGPLAIARVGRTAPGKAVAEASSPGAGGTLFAEAPEGWFVAARPGEPLGGDRVRFPIDILEQPPQGGPVALTLTLVGDDGRAIEVSATLDAAPAKP